MSLQEGELARCSPNKLEMMPDSPALAPEQIPFSIIQDKWLTSFRQLQRFPETPVSGI